MANTARGRKRNEDTAAKGKLHICLDGTEKQNGSRILVDYYVPRYNTFVRRGAEMNREEAVMTTQMNSAIRTSGKRTYTVGEIADILGIGRTSAYKLIRSGQFQTVRIGSAIRISKASFDDWLDKQL